MLTTVPFIVMVVGLILYFIATHPKHANAFIAEVSRICFAFGLLVVLLNAGSKSLF
jgi:hypothetical protein